jgi:hypothetical protein
MVFHSVTAEYGSIQLLALQVVERNAAIWIINVIAKRVIDLDLKGNKQDA